MSEFVLSRRGLLRNTGLALALGASTSLAGCQGWFGGSNSHGDVTALDHAPVSSRMVLDADIGAILADSDLREAIDESLSVAGAVSDRAPTTTGALDAAADRFGLDPRTVSRLVAFAGREIEPEQANTGFDPLAGAYWGTIVWADWPTEDLRASLQTAQEPVTERRRAGQTVFEAPSGAIATLGDGRILVGSVRAVEMVLDTDTDGPGSIHHLETALGTARPGMARFGFAPRSDRGASGGFGDPVALLAGKINYVSGAVYRDGTRRGIQCRFETGSGPDAEDVHESIDSFLALSKTGHVHPVLAPVLQPFETTRTGTAVRMQYEAPVGRFATWLVGVGVAIRTA